MNKKITLGLFGVLIALSVLVSAIEIGETFNLYQDGKDGWNIFKTYYGTFNNTEFESFTIFPYFNDVATPLEIKAFSTGSLDITTNSPAQITINGKGVCLNDGTSSDGVTGTC